MRKREQYTDHEAIERDVGCQRESIGSWLDLTHTVTMKHMQQDLTRAA